MIRKKLDLSTKYHFLVNNFQLLSSHLSHRVPSSCLLCGDPTQSSRICEPCMNDLPWNSTHCVRCAEPSVLADTLCGACIKSPPSFQSAFAPLTYEFPVKQMIEALKYRGSRAWARVFITLLTSELSAQLDDFDQTPDVIVPVPPDPKRIKSRPLDHTRFIARHLAKSLNIACDDRLVSKPHSTPAQTQLSHKERIRNLSDAFRVVENTYQHVALLDDVITTGATAQVLAKSLAKSGVERVDIWAIARTPRSKT
jgi:ComF family protein